MTATRPPGYDDRSAAPVEASRRGAHRARPKAIAAILPVVAGVAVVLLVIGAVYTVVGGRASDDKSASTGALDEGADTTAAPSASAGEDKGDGKGDGKNDDQGADESSPAAEESQDAGSEGEGDGSKVDKTIPLIVLNSLSVSGLAKQYQSDLEGKGWSVERTGNSNNKDLPVTTIYYEGDEMKPSANAVRKALGLGEISESSEVNPGKITVVLGEDTQ
ncbi:LytR C-terminal domain-containing protein [Kineosporia rhizophila]|uniref:LytR C-terminal domain-containing protein n=1 Tax=Kineosporia rhizophila TaxID=84633 RepID=UPI001E52BBE6|nr:LytR C-terminal domain-containing protein [Kineosporia rhizophila]MCE0535889.1 LytR C-terminal domain-containing protein [Kineosporia rhizophila]